MKFEEFQNLDAFVTSNSHLSRQVPAVMDRALLSPASDTTLIMARREL